MSGLGLYGHHVAYLEWQRGSVAVEALAGILELHLHDVVVGIAAGDVPQPVVALQVATRSGTHVAAAADATRAFGFGVDVGHCRAVVIVGAQGLESLGVGGLRCGFGTGDDGLGLRGFGACGRLPGLFWDGVCIVFFGH